MNVEQRQVAANLWTKSTSHKYFAVFIAALAKYFYVFISVLLYNQTFYQWVVAIIWFIQDGCQPQFFWKSKVLPLGRPSPKTPS